MYDGILLSTDGAVASEEAESHAIALAEARRPAEAIVQYADAEDMNLLVLRTKHRPEEYRALLESVTDYVLV
ncbi:universal stress protein [Halobaculum saliterrae]|uniref:universal stress protein n=1 Tax=Halobaculum saliterrae TaxID=2073113 RepID=UPI001F24C033|nr:universal stress protein [Halobaculum saliterrae]